MMRSARMGHGVVAAVALVALVLQGALVVTGASVLVPEEDPGLGGRLVRFVSYFTIQSNVLVAIASLQLAADPARDGPGWRVLRMCGLTAIVVTGVVHWIALRPLLNLTGWSYVVDKMLHLATPALATVVWLLFGPRPRITWREVVWSLLFPAAWLTYTLVAGAVTGWYPYPFIDVDVRGVGPVAMASAAVTALVLAVSALLRLLDVRAPHRP